MGQLSQTHCHSALTKTLSLFMCHSPINIDKNDQICGKDISGQYSLGVLNASPWFSLMAHIPNRVLEIIQARSSY